MSVVENLARGPGRYAVRRDGRDKSGAPHAAGVYFYEISIDGAAVEVKKLILVL